LKPLYLTTTLKYDSDTRYKRGTGVLPIHSCELFGLSFLSKLFHLGATVAAFNYPFFSLDQMKRGLFLRTAFHSLRGILLNAHLLRLFLPELLSRTISYLDLWLDCRL